MKQFSFSPFSSPFKHFLMNYSSIIYEHGGFTSEHSPPETIRTESIKIAFWVLFSCVIKFQHSPSPHCFHLQQYETNTLCPAMTDTVQGRQTLGKHFLVTDHCAVFVFHIHSLFLSAHVCFIDFLWKFWILDQHLPPSHFSGKPSQNECAYKQKEIGIIILFKPRLLEPSNS